MDMVKDRAVDPQAIHLVQGRGSKKKGGGVGEHYWHIYVDEMRVGSIFINLIEEKPLGKHASIHIKINNNFQNRGVGRVAYQLACNASSYDEVFAHMRKSNTASKKAAKVAGFEVLENSEVSQLIMVWKRPR